jgi:hypothetical protein
VTVSASFTIDGTTVPAAVSTEYGSTVSLVLLDASGASAIDWTIVGSSGQSLVTPTITRAGTPLGKTATFTLPATEQGDAGVAYGIKCTVTGVGGESAVAYGVVGVPNAAGLVPLVSGERSWRNATHGWGLTLNGALIGAPVATYLGTTADDTRLNVFAIPITNGTVNRICTIWSGRDLTSSGLKYREAAYLYSKVGGTLTQLGTDTETLTYAADASWAASHSGSGGTVYVSVKGDASNSVEWRVSAWKFERRV